MKKRILVSGMLVAMSLALPYLAVAAHNPINAKVLNPTILEGPLLVCVGSPTTSGNGAMPVCQNLCDLVAQFANIIYYAIGVVLWLITPVLITYAGIRLMLSQGNPEKVGGARKTVTAAVIGIAIVLCAWLIVFTFVNAFGNLSKYVGGFGGAGGQAACSI